MNIKKYIFSLFLLISFVSMQGAENDQEEKYYLKWDEKIDVAISNKVVDETRYLNGYLEDYKNEMQDNNVFDIKNMTKHLKLGDGETFFSVIATQKDIEHFAKFLNNSKSLGFGNLKPIQKIAFTQVSNFLGNEKAVDFAFKELKESMTDENISVYLESGASCSFEPLVSNYLPKDLLFKLWGKYAEKNLFVLKKPYFEEYKSEEGAFKVTPLYWDKDGKNISVIFSRCVRVVGRASVYVCYKGLYNFRDDYVKNSENITHKEYMELEKTAPDTAEKKLACGPNKKYFIKHKLDSNFFELFCSDNSENPMFRYSIPVKYQSIKSVLVSPDGINFVIFHNRPLHHTHASVWQQITVVKLNFQGDDSPYGKDFKENIIVRGLKLYKEKHKKPYLCDQNDKRMKLLSEEKKEELFKLKLLRKLTDKEVEKTREEAKRKREEAKRKRAKKFSKYL